jgi:hypothetical protein
MRPGAIVRAAPVIAREADQRVRELGDQHASRSGSAAKRRRISFGSTASPEK